MVEPTITEKKTDEGMMYGLGVKVLFNKACDKFESVKSNIVNKFLDAFSIAYIPTETKEIMKEGKAYRMLDDLRLLNTALTGNPVNTTAQMSQIITKSIDALEEYKAEKKINPDIADMLEVKTRQQSRNAAVSEEDEDEDEEKKKKDDKKPSKKSYEKDGGHSHDTDAIGEHNHPEIEKEIRRMWDYIFEMGRPESEETMVKSNSKENHNNHKEVKMTEETEKPAEGESTEEAAKPDELEEAKPAENSEPLNEVKSLIGKVLDGQKSVSERLDKLEAKDDEPKAPEKKANSKAHGAENSESQDLKAGNSAVGGLSVIR